jgi:hypothetical protein
MELCRSGSSRGVRRLYCLYIDWETGLSMRVRIKPHGKYPDR